MLPFGSLDNWFCFKARSFFGFQGFHSKKVVLNLLWWLWFRTSSCFWKKAGFRFLEQEKSERLWKILKQGFLFFFFEILITFLCLKELRTGVQIILSPRKVWSFWCWRWKGIQYSSHFLVKILVKHNGFWWERAYFHEVVAMEVSDEDSDRRRQLSPAMRCLDTWLASYGRATCNSFRDTLEKPKSQEA